MELSPRGNRAAASQQGGGGKRCGGMTPGGAGGVTTTERFAFDDSVRKRWRMRMGGRRVEDEA